MLEEIRKERKTENQNHLLEPLLALTGSLTLTQADAVSSLHKCDIPTQLYLSGKLSIPEAILWPYGPIQKWHFVVDDDDDKNMTNEIAGRMDLILHTVQALESIHMLEWIEIQKAGYGEEMQKVAWIICVAATFIIIIEPSFGFLKGFWFGHTYKRLFIGRTEIKNRKGLTILILHVPSLTWPTLISSSIWIIDYAKISNSSHQTQWPSNW